MSLLLFFSAPIAGHVGPTGVTAVCPVATGTPGAVSIPVTPVHVTAVCPTVTFAIGNAPAQPVITFNGTDRSTSVRNNTIRITRVSGSEPRSCSFTLNSPAEGGAFTPTYGMDVKIGLKTTDPGNLIFGGTITGIDQGWDEKMGNVAYEITCTGYSYLLTRRHPIASYLSTPADRIAADLVANYSSGFSITTPDFNFPVPQAPIVSDYGSGSYPATLRYYRFRYAVSDGTHLTEPTVSVLGNPSPSTPFIPSGTGDRALVFIQNTVSLGFGINDLFTECSTDNITWKVLTYSYPFFNPGSSTINDQTLTSSYGSFSASSPSHGASSSFVSVSIAFDGKRDLYACLQYLAQVSGSRCYVDDNRGVHFFTGTEFGTPPDAIRVTSPINTTAMQRPAVKYTTDLTQIRNRVYVQGSSGGTISIGFKGSSMPTVIAVSSAFAFSSTGGRLFATVQVAIGAGQSVNAPFQMTYTGTVFGSPFFLNPTTTMSGPSGVDGTMQFGATFGPNGSGPFNAGNLVYYYFTYINANGESSAFFQNGVSVFSGTNVSIILPLNQPSGFSMSKGATSIGVYRTPTYSSSVPAQRVGTITYTAAGVWPTSFIDNVPDSSLGGLAPATDPFVSNVVLKVSGPRSGTFVPMQFGGAANNHCAVIIDGLLYEAFAGSGGMTVLGLAYSPSPGTTVTCVDAVTGVGGSLPSGFTQAPAGTPISNLVMVEDTASQSSLAALEGGDGIHEYWITDQAIAADALTARGNAELALFKNPIITITYTCRDPKVDVGKTVNITLGSPWSISGDFFVNRVTISEIGTLMSVGVGSVFPKYEVTASSSKFTLSDLLRALGGLLSFNGTVIG